MLRKLEREWREQEARCVTSHPAESEASTDESSLDPGRRKQFPTEGETSLDLSDEEEEVVGSLSAFAPSQKEWPAERGLFSVLCRKRKWLQS